MIQSHKRVYVCRIYMLVERDKCYVIRTRKPLLEITPANKDMVV